ncbi:MAG: TRAP transporter small permease subunit [Kordiimonadaceae bacterium]|nr:TRAP transporter small permease subunit [Kordiimonadaceae bacterium]
MDFLFNTSRKLEAFSSAIARASVWLIFILMIVIISDVTLRRWFVIGSTKLQELEWHLHGALFLLCLGWAYSKNAHVRIELLTEKFSKKTAATIELVGCTFFLLPYVAAILLFGYDYMSFSIEYNEASASPTGLPARWIIKSLIVGGFGLLGIAAIARLLESIIFLFGPARLASQPFFSETYLKSEADTEAGGK